MLICPTCQSHFEGEAQFCPRDGSPLGPERDRESGDPMIGRVLGGRYRLVERLGQGGMGTVYKAVHTLMDKPVAVKILRAELATDNEAVARFHREARSASRLDHDHCIRVTDFGQSDSGLLFLVMELLDGTSLGQVVRRGPVPAERAAAICLSIAEALQHAHEAGIIHRDLKPDNVFLARRSRGRELVKVLDFGLAKLVSDSSVGPSITRDGTVFGTPEYMAPEQAEGEKLDGRTDLYAAGIILYQLLTGDVPFRATNFMALLTKQVSEQPVPPRQRRPDLHIPEGLEAIVLRCLAKRADHRYATAQELGDALRPFAESDSSRLMLLPQPGRPPSGEHEPAPSAARTIRDRPSQKLYRPPPSDEHRTLDGQSDSVLGGEVVRRAHLGRRLAVLGGAAALLGTLGVLWVTRTPPPPPVPSVTPPVETPVEKAERLLGEGQLEAAARLLKIERERADTTAVQAALSRLAEHRGNRLRALAHLERAARLAPRDPEPRARLAALLLRLGQKDDACQSAKTALKLDPSGARSGAARTVIAQARCKEAMPR